MFVGYGPQFDDKNDSPLSYSPRALTPWQGRFIAAVLAQGLQLATNGRNKSRVGSIKNATRFGLSGLQINIATSMLPRYQHQIVTYFRLQKI